MSADGLVVTVGRGGTSTVDPDGMQHAAARLRAAAHRLDGAGADLAVASHEAASLARTPDAAALEAALQEARTAWHAPHRVADQLRELADSLVASAAAYAGAESQAARLFRSGLGAAGAYTASSGPLAPALLLSAAGAWVLRQVLEDWARHVLAWARGGPHPLGATLHGLGTVPARMLDAPGAADATAYLAGAAGTWLPFWMRSGHAVRDVARVAGGALPDRPAVVTPYLQAPPLARIRDVRGTLAAVEQTYGKGEVHLPPATVTVQRLEHADGLVTWVVAIPGTQSLGGDAPTNAATNLELMGGLRDPMTQAVLDAMAAAGVGRDDPVMLVGHSQGGMVAASVAATGAYAVRSVVTAGSPDIGRVLPSHVQHVALANAADPVHAVDRDPDARAGGADVVVLDETAAPLTPFGAHAVSGYVGTAEAFDAEMARWPADQAEGRGLEEVLRPGAEGTVATTTRWVASTSLPEPAEPPATAVPSPAPAPAPAPTYGPPTPSAGRSEDFPWLPPLTSPRPDVPWPPGPWPASPGLGLSRVR